jgi:hypothetical protein
MASVDILEVRLAMIQESNISGFIPITVISALEDIIKGPVSTAAKPLGFVLRLSSRVFSAQDGRRKKLKICSELP